MSNNRIAGSTPVWRWPRGLSSELIDGCLRGSGPPRQLAVECGPRVCVALRGGVDHRWFVCGRSAGL